MHAADSDPRNLTADAEALVRDGALGAPLNGLDAILRSRRGAEIADALAAKAESDPAFGADLDRLPASRGALVRAFAKAKRSPDRPKTYEAFRLTCGIGREAPGRNAPKAERDKALRAEIFAAGFKPLYGKDGLLEGFGRHLPDGTRLKLVDEDSKLPDSESASVRLVHLRGPGGSIPRWLEEMPKLQRHADPLGCLVQRVKLAGNRAKRHELDAARQVETPVLPSFAADTARNMKMGGEEAQMLREAAALMKKDSEILAGASPRTAAVLQGAAAAAQGAVDSDKPIDLPRTHILIRKIRPLLLQSAVDLIRAGEHGEAGLAGYLADKAGEWIVRNRHLQSVAPRRTAEAALA